MNLQTIKPRARLIRRTVGMVVSSSGGYLEIIELWRVTFPGWSIGFCGSTIERAVALAYRSRLARITGRADA